MDIEFDDADATASAGINALELSLTEYPSDPRALASVDRA